MEKTNKKEKTFFHYFGMFCLLFIALYLLSYSIVLGKNKAGGYVDMLQESSGKYFICSENFKEMGEKLCSQVNSTYDYITPIGFAYGEDVEFEYIRCGDGELLSLFEKE